MQQSDIPIKYKETGKRKWKTCMKDKMCIQINLRLILAILGLAVVSAEVRGLNKVSIIFLFFKIFS